MKKKYFLVLLLALSSSVFWAQSTETFEDDVVNSKTFTDNGQVFNISGNFDIWGPPSTANLGWNGTSSDDQFIDNATGGSTSDVCTISSAGAVPFQLKKMYLFLSTVAIAPCTSGSVIIEGKLGPTSKFTATIPYTSFNNNSAVNGGYTLIDMTTFGGQDNASTSIDQFIISSTGDLGYIGLDAMTWDLAPVVSLATLSTTAATSIGAVKATLGGNITADGAATVTERGVVWATTASPTTADNKVTMGSGTGIFSSIVSALPPATLVNFRAYAINSAGTSYGSNLTFTTNAALTASTSQTNVSCNGGSDGSATVIPSGGRSTYSYSWSPSGGNLSTASGLTAGPYTCSITDSESTTIVMNFTVTQPSAIALAPASQTNISCNGGANGAATVNTPSGGAGGYTYNWTPGNPSGDGTASVTGLTAGTWTCTVTDANACTASQSFTITQPSAIALAPASQTNISCNGGANGAATVNTPTGGAGGYTYNWTPGNPSGDGTATVTGLTAGTWTCTVTDANSCTASQSFTITQPSSLVSTAIAQSNIGCNGGSNGSATVAASGGTPGYTYSWAPTGGTAATATGLTAGTYTVTITDANACTATKSFTITQPSAIALTPASQINTSCNGGANGAATVNTPTGGAGGYTYNWTPGNPSGDGTASVTGLTAGTWTCTVMDANSCTTSQSFTITQPSAIALAPASQTNISCNGGANGAATVATPTGGAGGYTYNWTPGNPSGDGTASVTGLTTGTWTCTVTDANACTASQSFTITQPSAIVLTPASQTNISCNGGENGAATVATPTGGAGGYAYNWTPGNPSGDGTASVTGLTAGTWTCTVTDANACTASQSFTITQPSAIALAPASQTNISCNGGANGAATVNTPTGGAGGYTYNWTPGNPSGDGTASVTGLTAGTWTCTVTDANSCTTSQSFTITQPSAIALAPASQTNISCNGGANGAATVATPSGGAGGYTYNWTPGNPSGDGTASVTGLTAGTWTCTVTDANACTASQSFTITQPTAIVLSPASQTNISCNGGANGAATVNTPTGGAGGYTYNWTPGNPSGDGTAYVTGLTAGTWTCTVTDANACTASQSFTIAQPSAIALTPASQINTSCNGGANGAATVNTPTGGAGGYTYNWTPGNPSGDGTASVTGLTAGTWTCTVMDANSCTTSQSFTITQPSAIALAPASQTNISCNGGANGGAAVNTPTGGAGGYTYNWTPGNPTGDGTTSVTGLKAGTWTCTVTDANACTATQSFNIVEPTALLATTSQTNISCNGGSNGSATVAASGGTAGYVYLWSNGATTTTVTGLTAGAYTVIITDVNDCSITKSLTLMQPTALIATAMAQTNVSCNGGSNGSATVAASGGTADYTYLWSPSGGTAATATGLSAGTYTVTVTDVNSCTVTKNFTITQPTALVATAIAQTNVSCNGGSDGSVTVIPSGGTAGYTCLWSPSGSTGATATGLAAGSYTVTITDASGCTATRSYTITQPSALSFTATTLPSYDYNMAYAQSIGVSGGTGVKTYMVTTGSLPAGFTLSSSGTLTGTSTQTADSNFTVMTTDSNGCNATYNYTLKLSQIPVTVTPNAVAKIYGDANPVLTYTVTPALLPGDSFTGNLVRTAGENIGTYAVSLGSLSAGSKYLVTYVGGNFVITAKTITVTANSSQTKVYGTADPSLTYSVLPALVSGDSFTGSLARVGGSNVGTYAIGQGNLNAGSNYNVTYVGTNFSITKANQTITWSQTLEFDCDASDTAILTATATSGLAVSYTSSNTNVAAVSNGVLTFTNFGSATITALQAGDGNYNAASVVTVPVVKSQPNLIRQQFDNVIFFDNSSNSFIAYSWYKNGALVAGQTAQYFKDSGFLNGVYYAMATKVDGTIVTACPLTFSPSIEQDYLKIAPNPVKSNSSYQLITNVKLAKLQNARIMVFNILGTLMTDKTINENTIEMVAPGVEGIYIVKMTLANGKTLTKNLLVRN